ncbi:DUF4190 domain-containing protein [Thermoactinospora rubra]|uniref:DUF4190 domain-containing protein n=1 Tax=Thermoactinospora rubra TaxID=1088767 RepID=UPI000A103BDE|nr:DUF4190 domain-containing protein [Thermoactinospora rubra]
MSYPPPQYGSGPQYGGPLTHPNGTTILVLGILSIVVCGFLGPFAWNMGNKALREIDGSGQIYENRGMVQAGRICGIIGTIFLIIGVVFGILWIVLAVIAASTSGGF